MEITQVHDYAYDLVGKKHDYHLRLDDESNSPSHSNPWMLDVFIKEESDANVAHTQTLPFDAMEEAFDWIFNEENGELESD